MKILGLDFETTCSDPKVTRATEVGAVLYDYTPYLSTQFKEIERYNSLIWDATYPPQSEKIVEITGITAQMLLEDSVFPEDAFYKVLTLIEKADVIMAHKVSFDKNVLLGNCARLNLPVPEREWLCTLTNFNWAPKFTCKKLSHLAYEHGIMVDPRTLHRADADVDLMMRLIGECYNFDDVLRYARAPWIYLKADVVGPWVDAGLQTDFAKSLGFSWEQVRNVEEHKWPKKWVRRVKTKEEFDAIVEAGRTFKSPFRVSVIEGLS